ncbi:MAG TPA: hemerythrin domain-containing protein [Pyrinomonadaceae bacterium]|nr:hemerythrin domain-containing protein [Pyrinomonadaceae bacterium]
MTGQSLLEDDHESVVRLLDELRATLRDGADARAAHRQLDEVWARLAVHIRAEHLRLFPALLRATRADASLHAEAESAVSSLRRDHDFFMRELAAAVGALAALLSAPKGRGAEAETGRILRAVEAVASRLAEHNAREEGQVYAWAGVLLDAETQARLLVDVRRELANLPPRFSSRTYSP